MGLSPSQVVLANDLRADVVGVFDPAGNQLSGFDSSRPANAAETSVPSSTSSVPILVANAARRRVVIFNNSSKTLFLAFGAVAVLNKGIPVPSMQVYSGPLNDYTGLISGIWSAANGTAEVTEITT